MSMKNISHGYRGGLGDYFVLVPILVDAASSPSFDDWLAGLRVNLTIGSLFGIIAGLAC